MGSDRSSTEQKFPTARLGTLEGLFDKLGEMRTASRKGEVLLVMRASGCAVDTTQRATLTENMNLVFGQMVNQARGQYFRLHGLEYAFLLDDQNEAAREFLPNVRVALLKLLSRIGAGQKASEGEGLTFDHFNLESDFSAAAKFVIGYIKMAREAKSVTKNGEAAKFLSESDLKAVIDAYRKVGAEKFLKTFARSQPICVSSERGYMKPKMTEFYISIDLLRKPFFDGVELREHSDRFTELTKILDSIMLNSFSILSKASDGQRISINLNVQSVFSKAFDNFIEQTPPEVMRNVVVEFRQDDAVINYDGYTIAREHLRAKGAHIAIDQIEPSAIGLVNISFLGAEIAKLHWHSDAENELYGRQEIVEKFRHSGIQPVLIRVDQERAHRVGQDLGIEMYQGFLIDDMLKSDANRAAASIV